MSQLLPKRDSVEGADGDARLVELDGGVADDVFPTLSSPTARNLLAELYREPATLSDLADHVDTSLQNAKYHVEKLEAADLVEVVGTWYSSRGREMKVYAPANESLVLVAGEGRAVDDALQSETGAAD